MRSVACLLAFGVLCLTTVTALETVSTEQAFDILDTLTDTPEGDFLQGRHLLQHGPLSHQLAVCRQEAKQGKLCDIIKKYIAQCRKKFGVHTLKCSKTSATKCNSKAYSVNSKGKCVCSKGYEHYKGICIACPAGKVKNVISYGQCVKCAKGKYQPKRGQATCIKCDIVANRVNPARSTCTNRVTGVPAGPSPTPTPTKPPTKKPTKPPVKAPTKVPAKPTTAASPPPKSPPPAPSAVSPPPAPVLLQPPPAPVSVG